MACLVVGALAATVVNPPCAAQGLQFGSDAIADSIESIKAKSLRSEAQDDRLTAAAHFSFGRMLLQHGDMAAGLRQLQRAYRWDPSATMFAREIVPIASSLGRHAEAVRYAILSAERDAADLKIILPLAEILAEQGEYKRAIRLLEKGFASASKEAGVHPLLFQSELGRLYLLTDQTEKASESFAPVRSVLESSDHSALPPEIQTKLIGQKARWYSLLGETYVRSKKYDDALAMYAKLNEVKPDEPTYAFHQAYVAVERGEWESAGKQLDRYFASKSTAAGLAPYQLLERVIAAQASATGGDSKNAFIGRLQQIRLADSKNVTAGYVLAAKYFESERWDEAAALFAELVELKPTPGAFRSLAEIYRRKNDTAAYLNLLGVGVEKGELTRELLKAEAQSLEKDEGFSAKLLEGARGESQSATERSSRDVAIALLLIAAEKWPQGIEFHQRAVASKGMPEHKVHEVIGMSLMLAEQSEAAAEIFTRAIQASPPKENLAAYHFYLSTALALSGKHDAALEAANKCSELDSNVPQFLFRPAWVLYHAKRHEQSRQRYKELLARFDEKFDSAEIRDQLRQARLVLSNIAVVENQLPEAEEWLEQVLDEFPEDAGAQNDLGYLWADAGKHLNRAVAMCRFAVESEPDNGAYRDSLGWALYRIGSYEQAIQELEAAANLSPDGVIYDHLGDAYWKAQQVAKAKEAWSKARTHFAQENDSKKQQVTKSKLEKTEN